jgi:putative ABC transport system permease protein
MAVTALDRKLIRDLWGMKGQVLAICLVMASGVATFVMSLCTLESLKQTQASYYDRYRFGHVFAHLKRSPNALAERIAEIQGVARVQTRVVVSVTLDVAGLAEPAVGRLISIPERQTIDLNGLHLRAGRYIEPGRTGEVLVSEGFAVAHGLRPGDHVIAVINGRRQQLNIVGVALSPEYVYLIREGDLLPDDRRFGVFWMGYIDLATAFDMRGGFNDVSLALEPHAVEPEVILRLDRLLAPYGGLGAYGRADQPSHKFLTNEINELRGMALVVPGIFLFVSAFLLHIVIGRLIGTQREQIATLKAFGYARYEVGWHYLKLVLLIVVLGSALGIAIGARLGRDVTELYTRFFHFPVFIFHLDASVILFGLAISSGAAIAGTLGAVWRAVRMPPAEAMQPEPPAAYRATIAERLGLQQFLAPAARMILRQLERRPLRATLSVFGIALAVAVLILGNFMVDALNYVMDSQFQFAERQDMSVGFVEPTSARALFEVAALPGVSRCEPMRVVPVRLRAGHRSRRLGIMGIDPNGSLFRVMDVKRRVVPLPDQGLVLSAKLAELLDVHAGDRLTVEVLEGARPIRELAVSALVDDFAGISAYMDVQAVRRVMHEGDVVTGAFLAVDSTYRDELYHALKRTPRIASVTLTMATLRTFQQTIAENLLRMRAFNIIFATVIAFGVVYNSARIALSERSRELATLRVLGFTRAEISFILLGELALLLLVAIPFGLVLGYGLAALVIWIAYDTELFRIPLVVSHWTYAFAATVTLIAAMISSLVVRRILDRLDLVAVLKSKE